VPGCTERYEYGVHRDGVPMYICETHITDDERAAVAEWERGL
jgi:hypothetical protein